jgi:CTP synthase (UTP-ammonia lyase)
LVQPLTIVVLMDLPPERPYHQATLAAVGHAASVGCDARTVVVPTDAIGGRTADALGDAVVVGPGSPYRDAEAVLDVIGSARTRGVPLVGT